jgi:hypothetical protein
MSNTFWFFVGMIAGSPLAIVWHEIGHAVAAVLLRIPLEEFSLGRGKRRLEFTWRGVRFLIAPRIDRGHVRVDPHSGGTSARRYAAMIAAGPGANLLMVAIVPFSLVDRTLPIAVRSPWSALWLGWGMANLLLLNYASAQADVGPAAALPSSDRTKLSMLRRAPRDFMALWNCQARQSQPGADSGALKAEYERCLDALIRHPRVRYSERLALIDQFCTAVLFAGSRAQFARGL